MNLYGISDLHLDHASNRQALEALPAYPDDWLIVAGDIGHAEHHLQLALTALTRRFAQVIWVPGNHDLWTAPSDPARLRGVAKYERLVAICRDFGVATPEDPYLTWTTAGRRITLAPLFLLFDYSFRPDHVPLDQALAWAEASGVVSSDEIMLRPDPYPTRTDWCNERLAYTERRLAQASEPLVLINHYPLRYDQVKLGRVPRFSLWCGTRQTEEWHRRYPVAAVVYGHLHRRSTSYLDDVRFDEVSLGYPRDWRAERGIQGYLRTITLDEPADREASAGPGYSRGT